MTCLWLCSVRCGKSRPVARIDGPGAIHFTACGRRLSWMIRARWRRVMVAFGDRAARVKYVLLCDVEPGQSYGCQPKIWKCACWFGLHRRWMHDGERVSY